MSLVSKIFGFQEPVGRRLYLQVGLALMALKYAVDNGLAWWLTGTAFEPLAYFIPVLSSRYADMWGDGPALLVLGMTALPFIWIGVSMSVRRARDAGWSPWTGLFFLCPVVNYLMIAALCVAPSRLTEAHEEGREATGGSTDEPLLASALPAVVVSLGLAILLTLFSVHVLGEYGSALFVATPFVMGVVAVFLVHRKGYRGRKTSLLVALLSVVVGEGALLLFALEGVICLIMVTPLAAILALMGAIVGDAMARGTRSPAGSATAMVLALPVLAMVPSLSVTPPEVAPVVTSLEIDAPPEAVWPHVVGFEPLAPPEHWLFKAGVAAPLRARIEGEGVGAVRHCEFTTGAFVEPITTWNPPHHLAFDVVSQPPTMRELGLWPVVHAPHVEGMMLSQRGEFRLKALPGGRTRLTGTTWYTLQFAPEPYWRLWADGVVHLIHERVLNHIATLAQR